MTGIDEANSYERVYTMTDYYDGPRGGIANFHGTPHAYASLFEEGEYTDVFELRPIGDETLRLALEDWEIWLRWEDAYKAGTVNLDTHPALPADRARHDEIGTVLAARMATLPGPVVRARGNFRPTHGHEHAGGGRWMEVQWTVVR